MKAPQKPRGQADIVADFIKRGQRAQAAADRIIKAELPANMAALIVHDIHSDLKARTEFRQVWKSLDESTQHKILRKWEMMALKIIEANRE